MLALAVAILSAGLWLGALVFQSAIVAPTLFGKVPLETASAFLRALFPRYYALGVGCSLALTASLAAAGAGLGWPAVLTWQLAGALLMLSSIGSPVSSDSPWSSLQSSSAPLARC